MNSFYLTALSLLLLSPLFRAEADGLTQFPKGPAAWTIDLGESKLGPPVSGKSGNETVKVEVNQDGKFCRNVYFYANGTNHQAWTIAGSSAMIFQASNGTIFITTPTRYYSLPFQPVIFDWLSASLLQEKTPINYSGKACFHYKSSTEEAWVDAKTLLPVALDNGIQLATYTFHQPAPPLDVPAQYKQLYDGFKSTVGK